MAQKLADTFNPPPNPIYAVCWAIGTGLLVLAVVQFFVHSVLYSRSFGAFRCTPSLSPQQLLRNQNKASYRATLRVITINVWSGSRYTGELDIATWFRFKSYETAAQKERRYRALVRQLLALDPDVVMINEAMPCFEYAERLAEDLRMDCVASLGIAGIVCGFLNFPFISEGDAVFAKPHLQMEYAGRERLTGAVWTNSVSFNLDDATQALAVTVRIPTPPTRTPSATTPSRDRRNGGTGTGSGDSTSGSTASGGSSLDVLAPPPCFTATVCCTHWHASVIGCAATQQALRDMKLSPSDRAKGQKAIARGTAVRVHEANRTVAFLNALHHQEQAIDAGNTDGDGGGAEATHAGNASKAARHDTAGNQAGFESAEQILGGDFNSVSGTAELQILHDAGFLAADSAVAHECTWDPANPNVALQAGLGPVGPPPRAAGVEAAMYAALDARRSKLDHVFHRGAGRLHSPASTIVFKAGDEDPPSDHYGVMVDFKCK